MRLHLFPIVLALCAVGLSTVQAAAELRVIGGDRDSRNWQSGGGDIEALVIRTSKSVEQTNAPGGVIDFDPRGRTGWIFPQRADATRNIAVGIGSPERGGDIGSNVPQIRRDLANLIDDDVPAAVGHIQESIRFAGCSVCVKLRELGVLERINAAL